ncbi:type II toxin-antitoxin system RelE/ParE family toxin [Acetobacter musti]|uniref:Type II toxin-antitoxin system RelE/ParE family toxin n=1 Tax=Acetobacter musti TaxID=864732 RepID=A0ABX0JU11_9PROT|nr:type II toxin-antitoxin system RelE/ParE family toxin [Acetobacter musti]NHN86460.1 type II toxin-antitoxin system RelE/ParE family toxin [Acetobacter musti]
MPQVVFSSASIRDLQRLHDFLSSNSPAAARKAARTIRQSLRTLEEQPRLGKLIDGLPDEFREWLIEFGSGGYVARYHYDGERVTVLMIRHQKEVRYVSKR